MAFNETDEHSREQRRAASNRRSGRRAAKAPHLASRHRFRAVALIAGLLATLIAPSAALAATLTISTPYPAVSVAPGSKVSFNLTIKSDARRQVDLAVSGVPTGWKATLRGGGFIVDGVTVEPTGAPPEVRLDVEVPADAASSTTNLAVTATSGSLTDRLNLRIAVNTSASGDVTMTTDTPLLKAPATSNYTFSLALANETAEDLTFTFTTQGPTGWTITATSGGTTAAATTVKAGSTATVSVTAEPPDSVAAGQYPMSVTASAGDHTVTTNLGVEVTGQYKMTLTTPDSNLTARANAGGPSNMTVEVQNTGTAALQGVKLTATAPSGWDVKFSPSDTIDTIAPNDKADVTAVLTPTGNAVAGDYVVTFNASEPTTSTTGTMNIRVTVETSLVWLIVGAALIVVTLAGLGWVFRRFGRR